MFKVMMLQGPSSEMWLTVMQISKYVEREIVNHKQLRHPHIVELKEVRACHSGQA